MRIKTFGSFVAKENLKEHVLKDCTVVIDAQNFFYGSYQRSGLQYVFGCESDKYANYLRDYLSIFQKANVKCYFIFKGGHEDVNKRFFSTKTDHFRGVNFDINEETSDVVPPIFVHDVYKQVLDEMGFEYTSCQFEAKEECIALAQKLKCPVISYDIEFCFSGIPYIMRSTIQFDENKKLIKCGMFLLDDFLKKYALTEDKLVIFTALTDQNEFPENHFIDFMKSLRIHLGNYKRNLGILKWLARTNIDKALTDIFRYTNQEDKNIFRKVLRRHSELIRRRESPGIPAMYLKNGSNIEILEKDQYWFEKGVATKRIPLKLVNLGYSGVIEGTWAIADYSEEDAILLSMDIIKHIYNLLTNFKKDKFILVINQHKIDIPVTVDIPVTDSIQKPNYEASCSPFENGWNNLKGEFFEHFLKEALPGLDLNELNKLPEDSKMLMVALIYFSVKKSVSTRNEVCSLLLSYVTLSFVVAGDRNNNAKAGPSGSCDMTIIETDRLSAKQLLKEYLADVSREEAKRIWDLKLLHPLVEFQHCFQFLNYLNVLCGELYKPTVYCKTYNATFVYKVLFFITKEHDGNCMEFLKQKLNSAPTVFAYIQRLINIYDDIMDKM